MFIINVIVFKSVEHCIKTVKSTCVLSINRNKYQILLYKMSSMKYEYVTENTSKQTEFELEFQKNRKTSRYKILHNHHIFYARFIN